MAKSAAERKRDERQRKKDLNLTRGDVWVLEEDWPTIRELEKKSQTKAKKKKKSET